ncbi:MULTISPECIES: aspartate/glutamate racemase family protein [Olivibacter]|jgi:Asp/Glu/hydantoin racemase|uniref:Aspartate/glutamate racemase family protein n=2 Tax=Olivibacter TaxID=376469 RepID=A0ABV6HHB5_9SPHI|nr:MULTISPECIES: aspartate/glutamate racemase family protein [Olivibacter]MDX3916083.1 aspartate/glutamate racemase family protein [Pseudosphingobacterium sp.]QEL00727.1 Asp/Glu/hydantoin racemase [Olivibacter sp. LS-1]
MIPKTLGLIHTSATLIPVFQQLCQQYLPGVNLFNIVDDSLVKNIIARGGKLTPSISKRVADYVASAEDSGADYILVTCSSIGAAVEAAADTVRVPVLRVDQPMADLAVQKGKRIGVIATLRTTLEPTADLVQRRAALLGKEIEINARLCEGAFEALMGGDAAKHDELVAKALRQLTQEVDVILLAQASMARVVDTLADEDKGVPILASPPNAIQYIANLV